MNRGKYFSERDRRLFNSIVNELYDDVVETVVQLFKISTDTMTNIYGEVDSSASKIYYEPVEVSCGIDISDIETDDEGFGIDRTQLHLFKFFEPELKRIGFYPEHGDLVLFNEKYFELTNPRRDQLLGGQPDKSFSIICNSHYISISNIQTIPRT
jgi:hypothetical protein